MTELIGQSLGSYQLEALLAAGPTGHLYSSRHVRLGRPAAIKLFAPDLVGRPGVRPRLLAALRDVAMLRHAHIAALYDVGDEEERLFVASELLAGGSLRALLHPAVRESVPLATRLELVAQAADGLAAAHAAGVVHGAVKPESLWLERRLEDGPPVLKLTDLGVAAALPEEALGAPPYLSPERCRGEALDARADIYSLGVVLYELLVGAPPFNVRTLEAATEKHLRTRPVPPRLVRPQLPAEVEAIALRCLAKAPADRFPDAAALAAALRQAAASLGPAPAAATPAAAATPPSPATTQLAATLPLDEQPTVRVSAPIAPNPAPRVQVLGPQGAVLHTADLAAGALTAGRAPEHNLFLDDPLVSRDHLRLVWDGQRVVVTDLGSANGSFLGAARLTPGVPTPWDGQTPLRAGPFTLRLAPVAGQAPAVDPLLAGLLGETVQVAPPPPPRPVPARVELRVDQARATLTPGAPALIPLRLENSGPNTEEVVIAVEGVPGAWLREGDQQVIRLAPGAQAAASLTVLVPRTPEALAGDYNVLVRARPLSGAEGGSAQLRWTVQPFQALDMRIAPPRADSQGPVEYQILLRNTGNASASYFLSFEDEDDLLGYALERDEVTLEPGETARVGLRVEAAGRLFGSPQERPFSVRADDGRREVAVAEAQLVHLATLPAWVPAVALGVLALALALGAWALLGGRGPGATAGVPSPTPSTLPPTLTPLPTPLPGAPRVVEFLVTPDLVAPYELITVTWRVEGAEWVHIDKFGDVPPEGQNQYRAEQTTTFQLTARAPGGQETVMLAHLTVAPPTPLPTLQPSETPVPSPTEVPPTAVPPTEVPPTSIPPTEMPPTEILPTAAPPTAPPAGGGLLDLVETARGAAWRTDEGSVRFGRPFFGAGAGGWAAVSAATLEDGQQYQGLLQMVPPVAPAPGVEVPFIEGEYSLEALAPGQILVGSVGFAQGSASQPLTVTVSLGDQVVFEASKAPDGSLLPVFADLSSFAGGSGPLTLRVSGVGATPDGLYWVRPRLDLPR